MSLVRETFTKELLGKILKNRIKDVAMVLNVKVTDIAEFGENFTCEVLKILVTYSTRYGEDNKEVSIFVKCLKDDEEMKAIDKEHGFYEREFCIYEKIFPTMTKMDFKQQIGPAVYFTSKDPTSIIFMEDMSAVGYKMQNRQEGLDLEHCLVVIKKLAYFHSASVALQKKQPEIMNTFDTPSYKDNTVMRVLFFISYEELMRVLLEIPGFEKYPNNMPTVENMYKKLISVAKQSNTFNALNHGDLWCNNILFQYQGNEVTDAVFVDYQLSTFGSPFVDLHAFFSTSIKSENKVEAIDTLLNYYLDELLTNLKKLNINKLPCREELLKDFKEYAIIGFGRICFGLPLIKANKQENGSLLNFIQEGGEGSFRCNSFNNPRYLKEVQQLLPFYDSFGVFN